MAYWRDTPGHGYLVLSSDEQTRMPSYAQMVEYEEDSAWSIPILALPELRTQPTVLDGRDPARLLERARQICRDYYPDIYERLTGELCTPENSRQRADMQFEADHYADWVVISAVSGTSFSTEPPGYCECYATLGGQRGENLPEIKLYVLTERYHTRGEHGYVVRPDELATAERIR